MFESIKAKLTTRNVVIASAVLVTVGVAIYTTVRCLSGDAEESVGDVVASAVDATADAVSETAANVVEEVAK